MITVFYVASVALSPAPQLNMRLIIEFVAKHWRKLIYLNYMVKTDSVSNSVLQDELLPLSKMIQL